MSPRYTLTVEGPNGNACQPLPSVTEIIGATLAKPQLLDWYYNSTVQGVEILLDYIADIEELKNHDVDAMLKENRLRPHDIRDEAAERGTAAQEFLADISSFSPQSTRLAQTPFEEAILHWWLARSPRPLASDAVLYSLRHGFAGTCDLVVELDRKPTIGTERALIDLKTRKASWPNPYTSDMLQISAYKLAWDEMHPENPIQATYALLALDDGSWRMVDTHLSSSVFLSLLDVYKALKGAGNGKKVG
jgi:hypothetical protein